MHEPRPMLLVGGAPRVTVDAARYMTGHATGSTALSVYDQLAQMDLSADLLVSESVACGQRSRVARYSDRQDLEQGLKQWLQVHSQGVIMLSAAINDYDVDRLEAPAGTVWAPHDKLPSGAPEVIIHLRPATKVVDQLAGWGHRGPLVAFKFQDASTVLDGASRLRERTGAAVVVANSICGSLQAIVAATGVHVFAQRHALVHALGLRIASLARG